MPSLKRCTFYKVQGKYCGGCKDEQNDGSYPQSSGEINKVGGHNYVRVACYVRIGTQCHELGQEV